MARARNGAGRSRQKGVASGPRPTAAKSKNRVTSGLTPRMRNAQTPEVRGDGKQSGGCLATGDAGRGATLRGAGALWGDGTFRMQTEVEAAQRCEGAESH